jgi:hypothetical protein
MGMFCLLNFIFEKSVSVSAHVGAFEMDLVTRVEDEGGNIRRFLNLEFPINQSTNFWIFPLDRLQIAKNFPRKNQNKIILKTSTQFNKKKLINRIRNQKLLLLNQRNILKLNF